MDFCKLKEKISFISLKQAALQQRLSTLVDVLRRIVPDISEQEVYLKEVYNHYFELKYRVLQAFQCQLMLKALEGCEKKTITVVDIGDSAGTHMMYLRSLTHGIHDIESVSVNLDSQAIQKIRSKGLEAILCPAEELDLKGRPVDMFTSFEMLEHLHNPAYLLRRLAKQKGRGTLVITVPYVKKSRVGLHSIRGQRLQPVSAEDEHIFEFSPQDWELLFLHSGWKVVFSKICYQYPRHLAMLSPLLAWFWKRTDFEGFWGAILGKDTSFSDCYQDWPEHDAQLV